MAEFDLTGDWIGIYNYPHSAPPTEFTAELRDHAGTLTGQTFEISSDGTETHVQLYATIVGQRSASDVDFIKTYDDINQDFEAVRYIGKVDVEGSEISGIWVIPGIWSGTFLMVRAKPEATDAKQDIAEPVQ